MSMTRFCVIQDEWVGHAGFAFLGAGSLNGIPLNVNVFVTGVDGTGADVLMPHEGMSVNNENAEHTINVHWNGNHWAPVKFTANA